MSLVRFREPMGALPKAPLPSDWEGRMRQAPHVMVGAVVVSEIFKVSQGKISEIHAIYVKTSGPRISAGEELVDASEPLHNLDHAKCTRPLRPYLRLAKESQFERPYSGQLPYRMREAQSDKPSKPAQRFPK